MSRPIARSPFPSSNMFLLLFPPRLLLWLAKLYGGNSGHGAGLAAGFMAIATIAVLYILLFLLAIGGLVWWLLA
jgi:hypothetical protein